MAQKYISTFAAILDNCQKEMKDIVGRPEVIKWSDWRVMDLSKCNGPCLKGRRKKREFRYNKAEKILYVENLYHCKLNDLAGILNHVRWELWCQIHSMCVL